jgi:NTP pyrophosphatase (non-canonical NTP hydrolase)
LAWIRESRDQSACDELFLYQQAAKLVEEVGELHSELLGRSRLQREEKGAFTRESLAEECADVAITLAILAEVLELDLADAIASKMRKVDDRRRKHVSPRSAPSL